ncbi:glycosyl hydrolase 115 family protein [Robertkochia solimangrovi]|uniref:glycosyl hydrolase 115 family protein n=1 Tax=Robertkochia solimangrovi TaxID=2213046 RepID=UPI0011802DC4|nr:glycosyl hydrolase 115 family protein [Robertkochia solimangrovi]TRZ45056.1 hypothetical protein DMZ48_04675 [Robertkochia solimangrovi]
MVKTEIGWLLIFLAGMLYATGQEQKDAFFSLDRADQDVAIIYDAYGPRSDSVAAQLLSRDIEKVLGGSIRVSPSNRSYGKGKQILIGGISSGLIRKFLDQDLPQNFTSQWESYYRKAVSDSLLIIGGTDARGTTYGVADLAAYTGVSPWYWWADVPVAPRNEIRIPSAEFFSESPGIKYRGIFINDEDWGLQPWAAKNFEKEVGDIGPKTYEKVFELLLRLKANTIWPAMHPVTRAFFHYPGNAEMAKAYGIVVGTSHAEPMLRNNVDEWKKEFGKFDYVGNSERVYRYWEERVKETVSLDAIYTVGMRGVHDSGMEGVNSVAEAAGVLNKVIDDQRSLLSRYSDKAVTEMPQAFTIYKEVLSLYDHGLEIPEDITLVWTDDNYGYIRRLSNSKERMRSGGAGVYYHASYWGRPHDYLWLSTTHPSLIREEMMKAYSLEARNLWILNVGDIKPAEYNMQLFMDMAFNPEKFTAPEVLRKHGKKFYTEIFGAAGNTIAELRKEYFDLAFERKPEFMGWSQTEPTTKTKESDYQVSEFGDEIARRMVRYTHLGRKTDSIGRLLSRDLRDAYFQLVAYPVKGAMFMNQKQLHRNYAIKYSRQGRLSVQDHRDRSMAYHDSILKITTQYNNSISDGKWNYIMDYSPRNLPVYGQPQFEEVMEKSESSYGFKIEGEEDSKLPTFYIGYGDRSFIDLYLVKPDLVKWKVKGLPEWVKLSSDSGTLKPEKDQKEYRILVTIDEDKWKQSGKPEATSFKLVLGKSSTMIELEVSDFYESTDRVFLEKNHWVSIHATNFTGNTQKGERYWKRIDDLGYSGSVIQAFPLAWAEVDTLNVEEQPTLLYDVQLESAYQKGNLHLFSLPTHPVTNKNKVRIAVQWDNGPIQIVNFETQGRSETWKQNVLRNSASVTLEVDLSKKLRHRLKIYMVDPGVALDYIYIQTDEGAVPYSLVPETNHK